MSDIPAADGVGHVLVVDDTDAVRRSQAEVLRLGGYQVSEAGSEEEALDILAGDDVDLLVVDLGLDHWGLRVLDRGQVNCPVILLSGTGEPRPAHHRVSVFIQKPVAPIDFLAVVATQIRPAPGAGSV